MFTGIIEDIGTIRSVRRAGGIFILTIETGLVLSDTKIGDSISMDGVCLTVVETAGGSFSVEATPETLARSSLARLSTGARVNLERALRLSDRLGGHLVQGHVEGVGTIRRVTREGGGLIIEISVPPVVKRYLIDKGSVAVDGISLTINSLTAEGFTVNIIGHTEKTTTLAAKKPGADINIETDVIGKYIQRLLTVGRANEGEGITLEMLRDEGYSQE